VTNPYLNDEGCYHGDACRVVPHQPAVSGGDGFAILWWNRSIIAVCVSKEIANGIAATFDALTPRGSADDPPVDSLLELVGFRQILAEVVEREAKRLEAQELSTRAAAQRLRGRSWP
jgi:hypothetical protein